MAQSRVRRHRSTSGRNCSRFVQGSSIKVSCPLSCVGAGNSEARLGIHVGGRQRDSSSTARQQLDSPTAARQPDRARQPDSPTAARHPDTVRASSLGEALAIIKPCHVMFQRARSKRFRWKISPQCGLAAVDCVCGVWHQDLCRFAAAVSLGASLVQMGRPPGIYARF